MIKKINILGCWLDIQSRNEVMSRISTILDGNKQCHLVTPNPEIILQTLDNPAYRQIINQAQINIIDGSGLLWAAIYNQIPITTIPVIRSIQAVYQLLYSLFFFSIDKKYATQVFPEIITGTDLVPDLARLCAQKNKKIFLLGGVPGVGEKTAKILAQKNPGLIISGVSCLDNHPEHEPQIVKEINQVGPDCLLVAYGAPKQEIWISRNLIKIPSVHLAAGIGGAFDYISQASSIYGGPPAKRAPLWLRKLHLEWLYRLFIQPQRINRIIKAVILFPYQVMIAKIKQ